jgi:DNA-binding CsgD family transcriptional regulator
MGHQPNNKNISAGTQVVALREVRGTNNSLLHPPSPLTPCEQRVVKLISGGLIQKEVASDLECSVRNVRKLLASAKTRMGARSLTHLIRLWVERSGGS